MYGLGVTDRFRRGYFVFLFLVIYLLPMLVILATCVRIAICLLQPIAVRRWPPATRKDTGRRHEENKRKVGVTGNTRSPERLCGISERMELTASD